MTAPAAVSFDETWGRPVGDPRRDQEAILPQLESDDFVACYQLHYPRLVRALRLAGAPATLAEEVAQEAFARLLTHWRRVRSGSSPAGYAYRSAFRLLNRRLGERRLRGRREADAVVGEAGPRDDGGDPGAGDGGEGDPASLVTTRLAVAQALAAMPPRRRACAVMCLVLGLATSDAAASLGIAEGTVRKHLAEARHDLRRVLTE